MILVSILGFCVVFHFLAHYFKPYSRLKMIKDAKRVLIVTSHPDDETMFFGPTILSLCRGKSNFESKNLFLLCMSTGDHKNIGSKRKFELYNACKILGIPEENITILRYLDTLWRGRTLVLRSLYLFSEITQLQKRFILVIRGYEMILEFDGARKLCQKEYFKQHMHTKSTLF